MFIYAAFKDRSTVPYAVPHRVAQTTKITHTIDVQGSGSPPRYARYFNICNLFRLKPPPPLHVWTTHLPAKATGLIEPSSYRAFIERLNQVGRDIDAANEKQSWGRVVNVYFVLPAIVIPGIVLVVTPLSGVTSSILMWVSIPAGLLLVIGVLSATWMQMQNSSEEALADVSTSITRYDIRDLARSCPKSIVWTTVDYRGDPEAQVLSIGFYGKSTDNEFLQAATGGQYGIMASLLRDNDSRYTVHDCDASGNTALHLCAAQGHAICVSLLLSWGARIDQAEHEGYTPLILASTWGHTEVVKVLCAERAELDVATMDLHATALYQAASGGFQDVVVQLLAASASPEEPTREHSTPLMGAVQLGHRAALKALLEVIVVLMYQC